jgi:two-component system, cell cycle response regulator
MRVLIADDSKVSLRILQSALHKWDYEVICAHDGNEAWEILSSPHAPRLVILDWIMPGLEGVQICQKIRQIKTDTYTYVILLTSKNNKEDIIAGLDAGADDYIAKPFDKHELKVRLRAGQRILTLQEELLCARDSLREIATRDSLTGIWNRGAILEILQKEFARTQRENIPLAVAMADIDNFKKVNDCHGHISGDEVLRKVSEQLANSIRAYDSIGRYGGEEFILVLPGSDSTGAVHQADRLRAIVADTLIKIANCHINVTISIGVMSTTRDASMSLEDMIKFADEALYRAKENGRNQVVAARTSDVPSRDCLV